MKLKYLPILTILLALVACGEQSPGSSGTVNSTPGEREHLHSVTDDADLLMFQEVKKHGLTFRFGYLEYDEARYGFSNPAILEVWENENLLLQDSFTGQSELNLEFHGFHELQGNSLVFTIDYGTEAQDYTQSSRFYVVTPSHRICFMNEYWSITGGDGYSSRSFRPIFPGDSSGSPRQMLMIERLTYHKGDQPDLFDTTAFTFHQNGFTTHKQTNNLALAK